MDGGDQVAGHVHALYLELECIPLGIAIRARRLNYLHHLVTRNENEMLVKLFGHSGNIQLEGIGFYRWNRI